MVFLGTLLRLEVSDLAGGLVLLKDKAQTQGSVWLLSRHLLRQSWASTKALIVTDPLTLSLTPSTAIIIDISVTLPDLTQLRALPAGSFILVDSLDAFVVLLGEKEAKEIVQHWRSMGCCCVCQSSGCEFAEHWANMKVQVLTWDGVMGTADCIHLRGYTKVTRELSAFTLEHDTITTSALEKPKIQYTPPAATSKPLVILEAEDLESPDEEGDEDDLI